MILVSDGAFSLSFGTFQLPLVSILGAGACEL